MLITKNMILEKVVGKVVAQKQSSLFHKFGTQHSQTAAQASQLGLKYLGFGRYGNGKDGKVTHIVKNKQLVQVAQNDKELMTGAVKYDESHVDQEIDKHFKKATPLKASQLDKTGDGHVSRYYRDRGKFAAINDYLHNLKSPEEQDIRMHKRVRTIDKLIRSSKLEDDTVLYTCMGSPVKEGGIVHTKSYRAATTNFRKAQKGGADVIEIHAKKGSRALVVDNDEVILPRDQKMRIVGQPIKTKTHTIWKGEIINI